MSHRFFARLHSQLALSILYLLGKQNFSHLLNWNRRFYIDPFSINLVLVSYFKNQVHASNVTKSHEAETPRTLGPLVL